jgi:transposase-like protein
MQSLIENVANQLKDEFKDELSLQQGLKRRKFSREFKQRLVSESKSKNIPLTVLADIMGIGASTVSKWQRKTGIISKKEAIKDSLFRRVEIQSEPQVQSFYLESRSGVRVLGLSLSQTAELLRSL